jgi:hypothetical protein
LQHGEREALATIAAFALYFRNPAVLASAKARYLCGDDFAGGQLYKTIPNVIFDNFEGGNSSSSHSRVRFVLLLCRLAMREIATLSADVKWKNEKYEFNPETGRRQG